MGNAEFVNAGENPMSEERGDLELFFTPVNAARSSCIDRMNRATCITEDLGQ